MTTKPLKPKGKRACVGGCGMVGSCACGTGFEIGGRFDSRHYREVRTRCSVSTRKRWTAPCGCRFYLLEEMEGHKHE